jgi:uncharacterized protein YeaO (DUF488 family)
VIHVSDDSTSASELAWENEGGRVLRRLNAARPSPGSAQGRVRVGRIYDPPTERDGSRVLVDRLWPRGMPRSRAQIDEWCRDVAPSTALRKWYGHDPVRFAEFARRYRAELDSGEQASALLHLAELAREQPLTLLTASRNPAISEARVLADLLEERPVVS